MKLFVKTVDKITNYIERKAWNMRVANAIKNVPKDHQKHAEVLIANAVRELMLLNSARSERNQTFDKLVFDVSATTTKYLLELDAIFGVQPMSGPVSKSFFIRHCGPNQPRRVVSGLVEAKVRKCTAKWNLTGENIQTDSNDVWSKKNDLVSEVRMDAIARNITAEILATCLQEITTHALNTQTLNYVTPASIEKALNELALDITKHTDSQNAANYIIANTEGIKLLSSTPLWSSDYECRPTPLPKQGFVELYGKKLPVYLNNTLGGDSTKAVMVLGFKGQTSIDSGLVLCPYVPASSSGLVVDAVTFDPSLTFVTRFGINGLTEQVEGSSIGAGYYAVLTADLNN